jgi:hypothetical protein
MLTTTWAMNFHSGLKALARHKPGAAVKSLQKALDECPTSQTRGLYEICFYLGVALRRIGYPQSAIKSWMASLRLNKRGHMRRMLSRFTNCYGMDRQQSAERDDWQAFSSIQTARYLLCKNKRTFSTAAEQDMIKDLVRDSWIELWQSGTLDGKSSCEKLEAFRAVRIVFPSILVAEPRANESVIAVNFQSKQRVELNDRCSCGSGLPYFLCCGRIPGREELLSGVF